MAVLTNIRKNRQGALLLQLLDQQGIKIEIVVHILIILLFIAVFAIQLERKHETAVYIGMTQNNMLGNDDTVRFEIGDKIRIEMYGSLAQ